MEVTFTTLGALIGLVIAIFLIVKKIVPAYALVIGALIGGGKAGNIISPNPNTIAVSEAFKQDLTAVMMRNIVPAICALIVTVLLALRPIADIAIDPLIALPVGGIVCMLATGKIKNFREYIEFGLSKVIGVSILLIGTGTIAGIIKASNLQTDVTSLLEIMNMPAFLLAPLAGILLAGATASTTAGATVAAQTFSSPLLSAGVPALSAAAMIHAGSTVVDSLPHGSFFHATGGAVSMDIKNRMKLIPYEAIVGLTSTVVSVIIFLIAG